MLNKFSELSFDRELPLWVLLTTQVPMISRPENFASEGLCSRLRKSTYRRKGISVNIIASPGAQPALQWQTNWSPSLFAMAQYRLYRWNIQNFLQGRLFNCLRRQSEAGERNLSQKLNRRPVLCKRTCYLIIGYCFANWILLHCTKKRLFQKSVLLHTWTQRNTDHWSVFPRAPSQTSFRVPGTPGLVQCSFLVFQKVM